MIKKVLAWLAGIFLVLCVYILGVLFIPYIPVNTDADPDSGEVEVFILTNGVHTDIVVPATTSHFDWKKWVSVNDVKNPAQDYRYLSIGWGDKGFYLNTPEWSDLTFSTAFKAAFWLSDSAMHCTWYEEMKTGKDCVSIKISAQEYRQLVQFIVKKFELERGKPQLIQTNAVYGNSDAFYEANGRYSLFNTCNTWSNDGLNTAHQKAALWTATDLGMFIHYEDVGLKDLFSLAD